MYNNYILYFLVIVAVLYFSRKQPLNILTYVLFFFAVLWYFEKSLPQLEGFFSQAETSPVVLELKRKARPLLSKENYDRLKVYDLKANFSFQNVAWTANKEAIYICTKNKETGEPEEFDVLMYVFIHELTHFICRQCSFHDSRFSVEFAKMLKKADSLGIPYKPKDKICGVTI